LAGAESAGAETEVWNCLGQVMDPELDEPVTDMGFIETVDIHAEGQAVDIEFRLPTYWCSPNFAFLMAHDIRAEVGKLSWVRRVSVKLVDHCFGDRINSGVNEDVEFSSVFAEYCDGETLDAIRVKFLEKAFIRRQESVLLGLLQQGLDSGAVVAMTLDVLDAIEFDDQGTVLQKHRYRSLLMSQGLARDRADPAFVTWAGERLDANELADYLSRSRGVRINMEFNGALCRGLKSVRYEEMSVGTPDPVPVPVRFMRDAVPH